MKRLQGKLAVIAISIIAASSVSAQGTESILPDKFENHSFNSGWQKGGNARIICAGLVSRRFPNRPFQIMSMWEEQKFLNPTFRIDSRYNYSCTALVKVRD